MAPFFSLFTLLAFALSTTVLASPHISRHVHNHAHRAIPLPIDPPNLKRSLNKRCNPRPSNSTTSALPTSTAPINVAPVPSSSVPHTTSSLSTSSYVPPTSSYVPPTSSYVPPPQTTSQAPSPTPTTTSTPSPSPTTSSTPPPAQTSSSSSNSGEPSFMYGPQYGDGTFYAVGLGACGNTNTDDEHVVAVSIDLYTAYPGYNGVNPNTNPVCGKVITASYQGASVDVTVVDACEACSITSLDFSPSAFSVLANQTVGRISIDWVWS